jgi:hypothetical protein
MRTRYKTKAWTGVACCFGLILFFVTLLAVRHFYPGEASPFSEDTMSRLLWGDVIVLMAVFFWATYYVAEAKGYSGAIALCGILGPPAQLAMLVALLAMTDKHATQPMRSGAKKLRPPHGSKNERIVIYRRNALVGIVFGVGGIMVGVLLVLFRFGIFADHDNEAALGMFVFLFGYGGVITGCWWWLKAKDWVDAIVFIGLLPIGILFIPYVRLVFLAIPGLMPVSMVMMPLILIVVVAVLPDKSGWTGRKRWRIGD